MSRQKLFGRITEIEDILAHAVIIEDENEASGHIGLGCTVQIQDSVFRGASGVPNYRLSGG